MDKYRIHFPKCNVDTDRITRMEYETFRGREFYVVEYVYDDKHSYTLYLDEESYIITPDGKTYRYDDFPRLALKLENDRIELALEEL